MIDPRDWSKYYGSEKPTWWANHTLVHSNNAQATYIRGHRSRLDWKIPWHITSKSSPAATPPSTSSTS